MSAPMNWLAATLIAMVLASSYLLDGPDEISTMQLVAQDAQAAQTQAKQAAKQATLKTAQLEQQP